MGRRGTAEGMGEFASCVGRWSTVLGEKGTWDNPPKQQFSTLPAHVDDRKEGTKQARSRQSSLCSVGPSLTQNGIFETSREGCYWRISCECDLIF